VKFNVLLWCLVSKRRHLDFFTGDSSVLSLLSSSTSYNEPGTHSEHSKRYRHYDEDPELVRDLEAGTFRDLEREEIGSQNCLLFVSNMYIGLEVGFRIHTATKLAGR
jgi:hypothetical protein